MSGARFVPRMVLPDHRQQFGFVVGFVCSTTAADQRWMESRGIRTKLGTNTSEMEDGRDRWLFVLRNELSVRMKKCE